MKILVLSPTFPWPLNMEIKIRIYHTLKALSRYHDITLVSLVHSNQEMKQLDIMRQYCSDIQVTRAYRPRSSAAIRALFSLKTYKVVKLQNREFRRKINQLLQHEIFDLIWVNFLNMLAYLSPAQTVQALVVLDQHNADELMWERYAKEGNWVVRGFARQNLWKLRRFRQRAVKYAE